METKKNLHVAAFVLVVISLSFKCLHWPGANIAIVLSGIIMILTLFMFAIKDNKEAGISDGLNYFFVGTLSLNIVALIFNIFRCKEQRYLCMPLIL